MPDSASSKPQYAADFLPGTVARDFTDPESGLRYLVIRCDMGLCAYVGVQADHVLAGLEDLDFRCYWGITFRGWGEEGTALPPGWFWWGWDYGHGDDYMAMLELPVACPPELLEMQALLRKRNRGRKNWTVGEVAEHAMDVLMHLRQELQTSAEFAKLVLPLSQTP